MKLLKKIAPIAMIAGVAGIFMLAAVGSASAASLNSWKSSFPTSSTVVVVGSSLPTDDNLAAVNIANELGLQATGETTITGENWQFKKTSDNLNIGNNLTDMRSSITKDQLPTVLADETFVDDDNNDHEYTQKITMATGIELAHFQDTKYKDKAPTIGFHLERNAAAFNYTLDFTDEPDCEAATTDETALETTTLDLMGRTYYVSDMTDNCTQVTLLDSGTTGVVRDVAGETKVVGGKTIGISFVDATEAVLIVDGKETNSLSEGDTYKLSDGTYVGVKDIRYSGKDTGISSVEVSVGNGKIVINDGEEVEINDDTIDGLTGFVGHTGLKWTNIVLEWEVDAESFITPDSNLLLPGFETVKVMFTGMNFPTGEEILIEPTTDTGVSITVPLKDGTKEIALLDSAADDGTFDTIGEEDENLVTSNGTHIHFNDTANDAYFIVTYQDTDSGESHLISASFSEESNVSYVTLKDELSGSECKQANSGTCSFGDVSDLVVTEIDNDVGYVTVTRGDANTHFDRIISAKGALFYLPQGDSNTSKGWINVSAETTSWKLELVEENKDEDVASGSSLNFTYGFTAADNHTTVSTVAGLTMLEVDSDNTVGYAESDLATKVEYDKTADEYDVKVTYYGSEVDGNAFIAGSSTTSNSGTGSVAITDDDVTASIKTSKNIVAVGGSAVNKISADLLGLTYPTYGSDPLWQSATGVTGAGKAFIKLFENKYATGKTAMLVAGWEGAETVKAAQALTTPINFTTGATSALIDTVNLVQINA